MTIESRVAAGVPSGGEFAAHRRPEYDLSLTDFDDVPLCPVCSSRYGYEDSGVDPVCRNCNELAAAPLCDSCELSIIVNRTGAHTHLTSWGATDHATNADHQVVRDLELESRVALRDLRNGRIPTIGIDGDTSGQEVAAIAGRNGFDPLFVETVTVGSDWTHVQLDGPNPDGGFTDIVEFDSDHMKITAYFKNGVLHRENGPARIYSGGAESEAWVNGHELETPDPDYGFRFVGLNDGRAAVWESGNGGTTVEVETNGFTSWSTDGDTHRLGGPAMYGGTYGDRWFVRGTEIPDPRPGRPSVEIVGGVRREYGAKYVADRDVKDIAKDLRVDIAAARHAGIIDNSSDYTVKIHRNRGGDTVQIEVASQYASALQNPARFEPGESWLSDEGKLTNSMLERLAGAYNRTLSTADQDDETTAFFTTVSFSADR